MKSFTAKKYSIAIAGLALLLSINFALGDTLATIKNNINSLHSFKADFDLYEYNKGDTTSTTGTVWIDFDSKKLRYETPK